MENSNFDVIIIGAGPSGLTLAYYLQNLGINFVIVEKDNEVGSSWAQMPEHLSLITFWKSNYLLPIDRSLFSSHQQLKAMDFHQYLTTIQKRFHFPIKLNANVEKIETNGEVLKLKTKAFELTSKIIVDCRGYYSYPNIPSLEMSGELNPKILHFKDYKNFEQIKEFKKILIVGKRLSAGQLVEEIFKNTNEINVFISARSNIKYTSPKLVFLFFLYFVDLIEGFIIWIKSKLKSNLQFELEVPMSSSVKSIIKERVKVVGAIKKIEGQIVYFEDGNIERIDLILLATGFHPPIVKLIDSFESAEMSNHFYLGRGAQVSFTSRFLRGIRKDAPKLAMLILGRLRSRNKSQ